MTDEEVKEMDKEMKKDGSVDQYEQMQQQQSGGMISQPPVDNTVENDTAQESPTPELDSEVERFSGSINRR